MITSSQIETATSFKPGPTSRSLSADLLVGVAAAILRVWRAYKAYRTFRIAKAQLMALDARMLMDIGIDRSEIGSVLLNRAHERRKGGLPPSVAYF
jgi:uncharacterized protein YjiS (DUF1127 family)